MASRNFVSALGLAALSLVCRLDASAQESATPTFSFASATPVSVQASDPLADDVELRTGQLPNGLTYYIRKNPKPRQHVELRLIVKAGSILEDDDQRGLAHVAEHMAFAGTRHFPQHTLVSTLESLGVKFGADLNAFTNFDDTIYILPLPLDKPENLETGIQILEDWAQGALMTDAGIEQERAVVLEEARNAKGAVERMKKSTYAEEYNKSRYAQRQPIGLESILTSFRPATLRRFYHDWYRPDLEAVIVVGDIDPDQVEQMITAHFASLTNPPHERKREYWRIAARDKSSGLVVTDKESPYNVLIIRYPLEPMIPKATVADYRQILLRRLCLNMIEQRLLEVTQQSDPPFIGASYSVEQTTNDTETVLATAVIGHDGLAPAITALADNSQALRNNGFSSDELERSKKNLQRDFDDLYAERYGTHSATLTEVFRRHFLFHESTMGVEYQHALATELIRAISLQDANQMVRTMIPADAARLVTYMGATGDNTPLPNGKKLLAMLTDAEHASAATHPDDAPVRALPATLMAQRPVGGSIVSKRRQDQLGLTEFTLSNGVKVLFKPTHFQKEQVLLSAARFGGQSLFSDDDKFNAEYAAAIQMAMGVGDFTPLEMGKIISGKSVHLQTDLNLYEETITGSTDSANIETLFQWLYLAMTAPRRDEQLFHSYLTRMHDLAKNTLLRPETIFQDQIYAQLFNHHPRILGPAHPDDFDHISLDRAMEIYRARFGSAEGMTFIITGSIDIDQITPLVTSYLGALPTGKIDRHYRDLGLRPVDRKLDIEVKSGIQDKSEVVMMFDVPNKYSLDELDNFYAAVDVIKQRIMHTLREQMSLTYNGTISGDMERTPYDHYSISARLPCAPEHTQRVIAALTKEIEDLQRDGPRPDELDSVKQIWIKERDFQKLTNQFWSSHLQGDLLYNTDPGVILTFDQRTNAITAEQVRDAARRYFDMNHVVRAVLHPADKNTAALP